MASKSRWKAAHDKFPAHVEEAKNSEGNVHRGYYCIEFRVAADLLRVGPVHNAEDFWAPSDWQLLLVVSEYMSALLEFLDWFWPDLGWEHHKQAIVLSKRLLQPRSPYTYPDLYIDPQLRAAWQSFTYCFWHGTRHLPAAPPPGEPLAAYTAAREWLTKLVGERGFEAEGHIVASIQSWIQSTRPRLQEAFPAVDWSRWPSVVWPDTECAYRAVEKRGAIKRRQQEEDYAVRWPLRVTQGRPKFNHLKLEARDGFVVGIPPVKNPPALGFLAVSDVMCAFKQAAQHWPSTAPTSPSYLAQQDVVQSFVQNVLRETRGPLAPGVSHEKYKYLGYVACSVLGWNSALAQLALPVRETSTWGPQPLALPSGATAVMCVQALLQHQRQQHHQHQQQLQQQKQQLQQQTLQQTQRQLDGGQYIGQLGGGFGFAGGMALPPLDPGSHVDLGIAAQLAMQPKLLLGPDTEAQLAMHLARAPPLPPPLSLLQPVPQQPLAAGASTAARAAACMAGAAQQGFGSVPLPLSLPQQPTAAAAGGAPQLTGQSSAPLGGSAVAQPSVVDAKAATRPRPSPFSRANANTSAAASAGPSAGVTPSAASPVEVQQQEQLQQQQPRLSPDDQALDCRQQQQRKAEGDGAPGAQGPELLEGPAPMSLGGLSSMQDLIDGLPSHADLTWSAILGTTAGEDGAATTTPDTTSELLAALPSLLLPSWAGLRPQLLSQQHPQPQQEQQRQIPQLRDQTSGAPPTPPLPAQGPLAGLQPVDSGLPYGGLLQPPVPPPQRLVLPDAPVHVQPPCGRAASPCQATITTGALPNLSIGGLPNLSMGGLSNLSLGGLPSLGLPSGGLSRPELSGTEPRFARRSHGEVFTLSPLASCDRPNGETLPCSPAPAAAAAAAAAAANAATADAAAAAAAAAAEPPQPPMLVLPSLDFATTAVLLSSGTGEAGSAAANTFTRDRDSPPAALPTGGRRTRQDVAAAAAAAAADQGLPPAPGSIVERCAKRPNAQADPQGSGAAILGAAMAERVESLGAFLTDQQAGLAAGGAQPQHQPAPPFAVASAGSDVDRAGLGRQLLQLLRTWTEAERISAQDEDGAPTATAAAAVEVHRRAEELLKQGAPVDAMEDGTAAAAAPAPSAETAEDLGPAGYTPLHWACRRGDAALAELLLRYGADPDRCDAAGTPARLVNPGFAAALAEAEAAARRASSSQEYARPDALAIAAGASRSGSQKLSSAFATPAGTAAAATVAAAEAAAQTGAPQNQLRNQLAELLRAADEVAAQLALRDPQAAAGQVLQAMRDTNYLFGCIVSGAAAQQ